MDVLDGITVKGYELHERIGSGGFGVVYRAVQSTVGREVAIKVILPGFSNHPEFIRRFEGEARMIARLEHLHIVPLYDYWRDPEGAYLVMRLMRGGNLRGLLQRGALELEAVAQLLDQICSALAVAHRAEIIHRDIKPANIMLDEDNNAYLSDFGIAKDLRRVGSAMTAPDGLIGSPDYLSPEQARMETVSPQTDIYSLGVVLYEMLVGEHPFARLSPVEQLFKHINDDLPEIMDLDPTVNDAINKVVQKATDKDPRKRYEDVLAMAKAFREAAALSISQVAESLVELLTPREQEVLKAIIEGKSNKEIAKLLTVELPTVKWYVRQLYRKLNVRSRVQAIVRARELNLIVDRHGKPGMTTSTRVSQMLVPENPYKGLRAFQIADEQDFFGRDRLKDKLIERMCEKVEYSRFLAIIGPSGSGKSSLVKAGLIPAMWRGELPGSEKWYIVDMVTGARPLDELEIALTRITADHTINIGEHLRRDAYGLQRVAKLILPNDNSELLLIIDQFEEVFTLVPDEEARAYFLDLLYAAVTELRSRVRVVITLRADFYDRPLHYPGFGELVRSRMETVLPLSAEELEQAIARPAMRVGMRFEEGLVAHIIDEVLYQPGALPLLQYALTELFEARQDHKLTLSGYQAIGGAVGALTKRAEEIYAELEPLGHECVQQMFLRLITLGEGTEDTRRRVPRTELLAITTEPDLMDEIIDTYVAYRLLSLDHDPTTRAPTVEVAHEAILREWERLREWLTAARDDIRMQRQLAQAAEEWQVAGQETSYLLRGARLSQFEKWVESTNLALTPEERNYLNASVVVREREQTMETARQEHEVALEKRARRFLQVLVAVFMLAAIISGVLAVLANNQRIIAQDESYARATAQAEAVVEREKAEEQASLATSRELAAAALNNLSVDPERSVLLALYGLSQAHTLEAENALHRAVPQLHLMRNLTGHAQTVESVAVSPDGTRLASASIDGIVKLWDTASYQELLSFSAHESFVFGMTFNKDGTLLATAGDDEFARVWNVETGEQLLEIDSGTALSAIAFSPDGRRLATAGADARAITWDAVSGEELLAFEGHAPAVRAGSLHPGGVISVVFMPDNQRLITGGADGTVRIWDAQSGQELHVISAHTNEVYIALSSDGSRLMTAGYDGLIKVWDVSPNSNPVEPLLIINHDSSARAAIFSADGSMLSAASSDGAARVWDANSGQKLLTLVGHMGLVDDVAFSQDGTYLLTGAEDGLVKLWDLAPGRELFTFPGSAPAMSPDGKYLARELGGSILIMDNDTGETLAPIPTGHTNVISNLTFSPDSKHLTSASWDGTAKIWEVSSGKEIAALLGHTNYIWEVNYSPDGKWLATFSQDETAMVWDAATGALLRVLEGHPGWHQGGAISPDGKTIATASYTDASIVFWDAITGRQLDKLNTGLAINDVAYSPDGRYLAASPSDGSVIFWDISSGEAVLSFILAGHTSFIPRFNFSPDGKYLATSSFDGTTRVWDVEKRQNWLTLYGQGMPTTDVSFSPDSTRLASGGFDGLVRIYALQLDDLIELAVSRLTRTLTDTECQQYLHVEVCPAPPEWFDQ